MFQVSSHQNNESRFHQITDILLIFIVSVLTRIVSFFRVDHERINADKKCEINFLL